MTAMRSFTAAAACGANINMEMRSITGASSPISFFRERFTTTALGEFACLRLVVDRGR